MKRASRIPPLPVLLERYPDARAWLEGGVPLPQALALLRAGLAGPADLERLTREKFLLLSGLGPTTLRHCERILGKILPSERVAPEVDLARDMDVVLKAAQWRALGFGTVTAKALERHGLTLARLKQMGRVQLLAIRGVGLAAVELLDEHLRKRLLRAGGVE